MKSIKQLFTKIIPISLIVLSSNAMSQIVIEYDKDEVDIPQNTEGEETKPIPTVELKPNFPKSRFIQSEEDTSTNNSSLNEEQQKQFNQVMNVSSINALLVGYGMYCQLPENEVSSIHDHYINIVNKYQGNLKAQVLKNYEEKVAVARDKGPSYSNFDCNYVKDEYSKIMTFLKLNK